MRAQCSEPRPLTATANARRFFIVTPRTLLYRGGVLPDNPAAPAEPPPVPITAGLTVKPWSFGEAAILFCPFVLPVFLSGLMPQGTATPPTLSYALLDFAIYAAYATMALAIVMSRHQLTLNQTIGHREGPLPRVIVLSIATGILFVPVSFGLNLAVQFILEQVTLMPERQELVREFERAAKRADYQALVNYTLLAILRAPVVEEVLFRGLLYPAAKNRVGATAALWLTSCLFAACHGSLLAAAPLAIFSAMLTWQYEKTGNLISPILTHSVFNLINVLIMLKVIPLEDWLPAS
ncbi:MAG: CPBP family intramembrane metalloprotease [Pedosphaera sp.]|nr:CPBP family intramembrane metalloprotease [Pedosphaera sp.]